MDPPYILPLPYPGGTPEVLSRAMWNRTRDLQTVSSQWGVVTVRQYNLVYAWLALLYTVMAATTSLSLSL